MIEFELNTYLRSKSAITDLVGDQIRPIRRRESDVGTAITYQRKRGGHTHDLDGGAGYVNAMVEIISWSQSYDDAKNLNEAVRNELQGFSGLFGSTVVTACLLIDEQDDYEHPEIGSDSGWFACASDYMIKHHISRATPT